MCSAAIELRIAVRPCTKRHFVVLSTFIAYCVYCLHTSYNNTGDCLEPGQKAEACERYTPDDGSGVVFIKLADGRGWVPVKKKSDGINGTMHL